MIKHRIEFDGKRIRIGLTALEEAARGKGAVTIGFRTQQMLQIGQFAIQVIRERLAKGIGSDDAAMKPLKPGYQKWKQKIGLPPIRDLIGPGATLYSRTVSKDSVSAKRWAAATKAAANARILTSAGGRRATSAAFAGTNRVKLVSRVRGGTHMLDNLGVRYADSSSVRMDITQDFARVKARANERRSPWFGFSPNDVRRIIDFAKALWGVNISDLAVKLRGHSRAVWMDPSGASSLRKVA